MIKNPDYDNKIKYLARQYGLLEIYVFGSRAEEAKMRLEGEEVKAHFPRSDLDIGIRVRNASDLGVLERVNLSIAFEDLFEVSRVDLVILNEADPFLALDIIKGSLIFAKDLDDQARYELFVMRRAGDLLPFKRARMKAILNEGGR